MKEGTFLVTEVDDESAVLRDATDGQIHTLDANPDLEAGAVVEGTIESDPPMEVVWSVVEIERRYSVTIEQSGEPPTRRSVETAAAQSVGEVTRHERAGTGEVHVLTVSPERTDSAVGDVVDDVATVERAARLGVERVEIRADDGVVSVRYLP